jgi:parvulin-like peptidyl-prolyl isomerase
MKAPPRLLLCALLLPAFACRGGRAQSSRQEIARVNDERIYLDELEREMRRSLIEGVPQGTPEKQLTREDRQRLLGSMIDRKLLLQEAARVKIFVPITQSERLFNRWKDEFAADDFSKELEQRGLTPMELKQSIQDRLVVAKLLQDQVYDRIYIKDEQITAYYEQHADIGRVGERVHCAQIVLKTEADMSKVRGEIVAGMPFEEAATRYSIAPERDKGGDLGWFERKVMPGFMEDACFALKPGEISKMVTSDQGLVEDRPNQLFHLFKLLGRKDEETQPLAVVRDKIEQKLKQERTEQDELAFLAALKKKAQIVVDEDLLARAR